MSEKSTEKAANKAKGSLDNQEMNMNFSALDPFTERNIPSLAEKEDGRSKYVIWGEGNRSPYYFRGLYEDSDTLSTVVNAITDYAAGNGVEGTDEQTVRSLATDYVLFGCMAMEVKRNPYTQRYTANYIRVENIRCNKDNSVFWYSKDFAKSYGQFKTLVYPAFVEGTTEPVSILFMKNNAAYTYGFPLYGAALKACEIERKIADFHLNQISNGFSASYLFNFNNGVPADNIKEEIEDNFTEKFTGTGNAGRVLMSFNKDITHKTTAEKLATEDFAAKYDSLVKWARTAIISKFRCSPQVVGINLEGIGFSSQEYADAFKIFNRSTVYPVQKAIVSMFEKIGQEVKIEPFGDIEERAKDSVQSETNPNPITVASEV